MEAGTDAKTGEDLERELEELLDTESFEPPEEFAAEAAITDESIAAEAAEDPVGYWEEKASRARLVRALGHGARRLRSAVLQVVRRRQAERLAQLPRPPRRERPGRPRRVPLARGGGRGARRHLRRPAPRRPAARERAEGPRDREGRRGRDLPADDPRGRRRDARLRADRRAAQRRLRRLLAGLGQGPDAVLRGEGADHRRRRAAQGQDRRDQAGRRRLPRTTCRRSRPSSSSATPTPTWR